MASPQKVRAIALLALCVVMALALWFSATAVIPALQAEYELSSVQISLFTSMVQAGFVLGTLTSAFLGLADRLDPRRFFMGSALVAAAANTALLWLEPGSIPVYAARFVIGMCMAGVYPVGMKMASSWADRDLGLLVAILVGALTVGSGSPHLINAFGGVDWRFTIAAASVAAAASGLLALLIPLGPKWAPAARFSPGSFAEAFRNPALRLANLGYLGHMWELYAMWAWIGLFLAASFQVNAAGYDPTALARIATFLVVGACGAIGCLAGGWLSDRHGRTAVTIGAMAISGLCALLVGSLFGASPTLLIALCGLWGAAVIADSAQFSASVAELSPPQIVGTMLTVQTCAGFLLTLITIHLMPIFIEDLGWNLAFAPLAIGPFLGIVAMARLKRRPEAAKLAGGRG
ncbi:MAG: MFS transporter [Rhodospirillaceae bacterium]|nr:MFS transporter [Rhodospirillaceae bacterium]